MDCNKHKMVSLGLIIAFVLGTAFSFASCSKETTPMPDDVQYPDNAVMVEKTTKMPVHIPSGDPAVADLDGDGEMDVISYSVSPAEEATMAALDTFTVNGTEFKDSSGLAILTSMEVPWLDGFYIVDVDTADDLLEIAILDEGPSSDPVTYFFRYDGIKLYAIGEVPDFPESKTCHFVGDGSITAQLRLDVLQTWWAPATWRLNQRDYLQREDQTTFIPYEGWNTSVLLEDLPLYESKDQDSKTTLALKGSGVTFLETDNRHWLKIRAESGIVGWVYLEDYSNVIIDGEAIPTLEIFKDLSFAD